MMKIVYLSCFCYWCWKCWKMLARRWLAVNLDSDLKQKMHDAYWCQTRFIITVHFISNAEIKLDFGELVVQSKSTHCSHCLINKSPLGETVKPHTDWQQQQIWTFYAGYLHRRQYCETKNNKEFQRGGKIYSRGNTQNFLSKDFEKLPPLLLILEQKPMLIVSGWLAS